jgi:hypothetical protein
LNQIKQKTNRNSLIGSKILEFFSENLGFFRFVLVCFGFFG